jgi:hypothetical protein
MYSIFSIAGYGTFFSANAFAQKNLDYNAFAAIDAHALNAPANVEKSVETLAKYLTAPAKNNKEKARAIFRWITHNSPLKKPYFTE